MTLLIHWFDSNIAYQSMTPHEQLMEETRGLISKWNNVKLSDPKDWPVITESFGILIIDGVRHEFKSHEEAAQFRKQNKL